MRGLRLHLPGECRAPKASRAPGDGLGSETRATPPKSSRVPRVARIGGIFKTATSAVDESADEADREGHAEGDGDGETHGRGVTVPREGARSVRAAQMEATLAIATTDRSIPAVNMVNMTPRAHEAELGEWTVWISPRAHGEEGAGAHGREEDEQEQGKR